MTRIYKVSFLLIFFISCAEDNTFNNTIIHENPCEYIVKDFNKFNINDSIVFGTDSTLDIITWNIENFPKHNSTVDYLVELINLMDVEIIALQEIENATSFKNIIEKNLRLAKEGRIELDPVLGHFWGTFLQILKRQSKFDGEEHSLRKVPTIRREPDWI